MNTLKNAKWRSVENDPPPENVEVLTQMKHGVISGFYNAEEGWFEGYYFEDISWYAMTWFPMD
jgi:hypothetical protein